MKTKKFPFEMIHEFNLIVSIAHSKKYANELLSSQYISTLSKMASRAFLAAIFGLIQSPIPEEDEKYSRDAFISIWA